MSNQKQNTIFVNENNGAFANKLFSLFYSLSYYEYHKNDVSLPIIVNRNYEKLIFPYLKYIRLNFLLGNFFSFKKIVVSKKNITINDENKGTPFYYKTNSDVLIEGFCQDVSKINEKKCQDIFICPPIIKEKIEFLYGDVTKYVSLHVRRGDFVTHGSYKVLTKEYIENVIKKFYPNDKIIVISDDMTWCKENLSNLPNIIFADKENNCLIDFFIQTFTKGNICSPSSFSIAGAILNKNNNCVIPKPFFIYDFPYVNLNLPYAKYEEL